MQKQTHEEHRTLTVHAAGPVRFEIRKGSPSLIGTTVAKTEGIRRELDLAVVNPSASPSSTRAVYWTFGDVAQRGDQKQLEQAPATYDVTFVSPKLIGREFPRTHGHVHTSRDGAGEAYSEIYEVLAGHAGFLLQDLRSGPEATYVILVDANEGDVVAIPPGVFHATLNVGSTLLVVADLVCRRASDSYDTLRAAGGMAYGLDASGRDVPNAQYHRLPPLQRLSAQAWGGTLAGGLYERLLNDPGSFGWLCDRAAFALRFPEAWRRVDHQSARTTRGRR